MLHRTRSRLALVAGVALAATVLAGCSTPSGEGEEPTLDDTPTALPDVECVEPDPAATLQPVSLMLQWLPQAQFGGYFAADCLGYFAEAGLDVEIIPTGGDIVPQEALFAGDADYAIAWVPKVLGSIEASGIEVTNIVVQDTCSQDRSDHLSIVSNQRSSAFVLNALDPAHPRTVPCLAVPPYTGA